MRFFWEDGNFVWKKGNFWQNWELLEDYGGKSGLLKDTWGEIGDFPDNCRMIGIFLGFKGEMGSFEMKIYILRERWEFSLER